MRRNRDKYGTRRRHRREVAESLAYAVGSVAMLVALFAFLVT